MRKASRADRGRTMTARDREWQCSNPDCPWWNGSEPAALSTDGWDRVYASTRASFRVVQPCGRHVARESTLISEHPTAAAAFAEIDRLAFEMGANGCAE